MNTKGKELNISITLNCCSCSRFSCQSLKHTESITCAACDTVLPVYPAQNFESKVVIEGILYPGQASKIYVSRSLPFFDERVTLQQVFARGAIVTLSDDTGSEVLKADSSFEKFRCRWCRSTRAIKFPRLEKHMICRSPLKGKPITPVQ
jgi:hypothetical protein